MSFFKSERKKSKEELSVKLHEAIALGDKEAVEGYIKAGASLSYKINNLTPIMQAVQLKKFALIRLIAALKNAKNIYGYHLALAAILSMDAKNSFMQDELEATALALIAAKTNLNKYVRGRSSFTLLHLAIEKRNLPVIEALIDKHPALLKANSADYFAPLAFVAELLIFRMREKKYKEAKEYWALLHMLIPVAGKLINQEWLKNSVLTSHWEELYGLKMVMFVAAKYGNYRCLMDLREIGLSWKPGRLSLNESALHFAAKPGKEQFTAAAIILYFYPGLAGRPLFHEGRLQSPADYNPAFIKVASNWRNQVHLFITKALLILRGFALKESSFFFCSHDLCPVFILNLVFAMSRDLALNLEKQPFPHTFPFSDPEKRVNDSVEKISLEHKLLALASDYKYARKQLTSPASEAWVRLVKAMIKVSTWSDVHRCVNDFIEKEAASLGMSDRTLIAESLKHYGLITPNQTSALHINMLTAKPANNVFVPGSGR